MTDMIVRAREVAHHLEGDWKEQDGVFGNGTDAYLYGPDGEKLQIRPGTTTASRDRFEIYGSLSNRFTRHNEPRHLITVSPEKTSAQIAGDITRRLLPAYREGMALAVKAKVAHELREAEKANTIKTLLGILPDVDRHTHAPDTMDFGAGPYGEPIGGQLRVLSDSDAEWTIHTSKELSHRVAEMIYALYRDADIPREPRPSTTEVN